MSAPVQNNAPIAGQGDEGGDQNREGAVMNIIPETDEARQAVREWALAFAATSIAPAWPKQLIPWWVQEVKVSHFGGGEATVQFVRKCGETEVTALVIVVISNKDGWVVKHPESAVGEFSEDGVEVTIVGPHEAMNFDEATDVFFSLAEAVRVLRQIKDRAEVAA